MLNYDDAIKNCNNKNGKLFEPKSLGTNKNVYEEAVASFGDLLNIDEYGYFANRIWIGINDIANEDNFEYDNSGDSISIDSWDTGQPDNYGNNEDCVEFAYYNKDKWNDADCSKTSLSICEATGM